MFEYEGGETLGIRKMREAAGLKQYELAARMGLKQASVSEWENGQT